MSDKPLVSAEEMASVLSDGGQEEANRQDAAPESPTSDRYSLRRPLAIPPDDEAAARRRLAETARALGAALSSTLDAEFELEVHGFQQQQVRAAVDRLTGPAWVLAFGAGGDGNGDDGPSGGIVLGLDPSSALAVVELVLGGSGTYSAAGRKPTRLETRVMEDLTRLLADELAKTLDRPLPRAAFQVGGAPRAVASPGEMVGAGLLRIRISGSERNGVLLVTPDLLRPTEEDAPAHPAGSPGPLAARLASLPFETRPVLRAGVSTLDELSRLKAGDILRLDAPADAPLELRVGGVPLFVGRIDRSERGAAFRVERRRVPGAPSSAHTPATPATPRREGRTA